MMVHHGAVQSCLGELLAVLQTQHDAVRSAAPHNNGTNARTVKQIGADAF